MGDPELVEFGLLYIPPTNTIYDSSVGVINNITYVCVYGI